MDSGPSLKPKVTAKLNHDKTISRPLSRNHITNIPSRPGSPTKPYVSSSLHDSSSNFRPKAKVNSSATTRKPGLSTTSSVLGSTSSTPRPGSPTKFSPHVRNGVVSPTNAPKAQSTVGMARIRSPAPAGLSAPVTPEMRNRSFTTASGSTTPLLSGHPEDSRTRTGSVSLHHAVSFSSFNPPASVVSGSGSISATASPRLMPSKSVMGLSEQRSQTSSPTLRIRSKVSNLAKAAAESPQPPSPPTVAPLYPSSRPNNPRTRATSNSAPFSQQQQPVSPPPQIYPITAAAPSANPHRYAVSRPPAPRTSPPSTHHIFQSFSDQTSPSTSPNLSTRSPKLRPTSLINGSAKVDPASIPLPPHSPPASTVSFSSRSSASVSYLGKSEPFTRSESTSTDDGRRLSPSMPQVSELRTTLNNLMEYTSGLPAEDDDGDSSHDRETDGELGGAEERKVKAAAKSNRKIADLEITNRSLLAINATLEATKHRQAKEIHELRRKLRESRLILPPRAYRAVKSSLGPAESHDDEEDVDDEDIDSSDVEAGDEIYKRIKVILDSLLKSGQAALEKQVKDFPEGGKGGAKVLSPEELKDYHGDQDQDLSNHERRRLELGQDREQDQHDDDDMPSEADMSFDSVGNDSVNYISEDEVESMTIPAGSPPSSPPPPPILITHHNVLT
ncbi:hypothetical protein M413DRAFT_439200 [Hebeloma cylindrosporum]|uniref:Uncharacterized protein n=1 Tax=Hebeloma cylindrosporum TaxID=76867 RepID=A0A0C2YCI2_HEBCY|nr:hypothetical protein M413DRAFT_439200 [Hebeloma cylindrosporum h7]